MVIQKKLGVFLLVILAVSFVSAVDVAYLLKNDRNVQERVVDAIEDMDLSYDVIEDADIPFTNFDNYKAIFLDDVRFRKIDYVPIGEHKMVIMNKYYGEDFGLTDRDGVSQLAGTSALSVEIPDTKRVEQVYTQAFSKGTIGIPYYYFS